MYREIAREDTRPYQGQLKQSSSFDNIRKRWTKKIGNRKVAENKLKKMMEKKQQQGLFSISCFYDPDF